MAERQLLFIHGAGVKVDDPNGMPTFLHKALDGQFEVATPQMPDEGAQAWIDAMMPLLVALPDDGVLVGHSLGGSTLLKAIAERKPGLTASGLILLSPPYWGAPEWDYLEFAPPKGFAEALGGLGTVIHLQGKHDEVVDVSHQALYAADMPDADYRAIDCGHEFDGKGQAALLAAIATL